MTTPFPIGLLVALLHINTHVAEGISNKPESCIYFPKSALTTLIDLNRGLLGSDLTLLFYVLLDVIVPNAIEPPSMQIQCVNSFLSTIRIVAFSTVIEIPFIVAFVFLLIEMQYGVCPS